MDLVDGAGGRGLRPPSHRPAVMAADGTGRIFTSETWVWDGGMLIRGWAAQQNWLWGDLEGTSKSRQTLAEQLHGAG